MSKDDKGFDRLIADYMREMFDERNVSAANREKLWKQYYDRLSKAVDVGYSPQLDQYDPELAHSLKYNIAKFSAFKESSFKDQLEAALTKKGEIIPWSEFKNKAFAVSEDYNKRWLKTEYHQTVATANMAGKWKDFEQNKDLYPNIKYVTAGDKRVREKHAQWDGLVLPMDHSFWKENLPPNDWGCRCDVIQTDEEVTQDIPSAAPKEGFDNNPAVSGEVFTEIPYKKGMDAASIQEAEAFADRMMETLDKYAANYGVYRKLRNNKKYLHVKFDAKGGGMKATHVDHKFDKVLGHLEKEAQNVIYKSGHRIILESELGLGKQIEGFLDDYPMEIKSITGNSFITIKRRIFESVKKGADICVLYFPNGVNPEILEKALREYRGELPKLMIIDKDKIIRNDI